MTRSSTPSRTLRCAVILLATVPSLSSGASGPKKLPVCDGKHLRDVNIYGSVLPGSPIPAVVAPPAPPPVPQIAPPGAGTPPPPVPASTPEKTSARAEPNHYRSC
jgi:hypothetical protein